MSGNIFEMMATIVFQQVNLLSKSTCKASQLVTCNLWQCRPKPLHSTFNFKAEAFGRPMSKVLLTDFFGDRKRVASRRQKAAHAQCTSHSGHARAHNESNIEWQTSVQVTTDADKAYSTPQQSSHHQEKLYVVGQPLMNNDLALLLLFSALSFVACSVMNRHQDHQTKQCQLVCWSSWACNSWNEVYFAGSSLSFRYSSMCSVFQWSILIDSELEPDFKFSLGGAPK